MARTFTPVDAAALMTELVKEATHESNIDDVDLSSFVSAGETVMATGTENTLNALAIVLGRRFMAVRPRQARMKIVQTLANSLYEQRLSKVSFFARNPQAAGDWNTNLYTNLANGYDNGSNSGASVGSMWEQNQPVPLEMNFGGMSVWDDSTTVYENQLAQAMRSPEEMARFMNACMLEKKNDISRQKEAWNRAAILSKIAGVYDLSSAMPGSVINLTAAFNSKYGTSYTSDQLRTTYLKEFLAFFVVEFNLAKDWLTYDSVDYHLTPTKLDGAGNQMALLRHTPYSKQRVMLYEPLFKDAKANVFSEIFNPEYINLESQYEGVLYWQAKSNPTKIDIYPAVYDKTTGTQKKGNHIQLDYVVGMIFDEDALMTSFKFEDALSTPVEARKRYHNIWYHFAKNIINDYTENTIIFIMADPAVNPSTNSTRKK